jgi:hypothetical protein
LHHKEIHISGKKSRSKEQTGSDRIRQEYISDIENYCIIKKFIYQIENLEVRNRQELTGSDRIRQDQTGSDRIRQDQTGLYI